MINQQQGLYWALYCLLLWSLTWPVKASSSENEQGTQGLVKRNDDCPLSTELEEGPFYLSYNIIRNNIVEDRIGLPFQLQVTVLDASTCLPVQNAGVDIWHADANGMYSGWAESTVERDLPDDATTFLRGIQITGSDGLAIFNSIIPGWVHGRSTHINVYSVSYFPLIVITM